MNQVLDIIWLTFQLFIGWHLLMPLIWYVLFILKDKRRYGGKEPQGVCKGDYAIIVTAYEQTHMLPYVVSSLLNLRHDNYHIYIVADNCDDIGLNFDHHRVTVFKPEHVLANNVKSHFYAIDRFVRPHSRLTIIDSDNIVDSEYLNKLDRAFGEGYEAVQGVRKAKNLNTVYACLDAVRDVYYHFYDGKLLFSLGSSATLSGSGMAFTVSLYKTCLADVDISGAGFDKVLQYRVVKRDKRIAFTDAAVVFDEKTAYADQLVKQRARWLNTWFKYVGYGLTLLKAGFVNKSLNQLLFGLVLVRPPLFIFLIISLICLGINCFFNPWVALAWAVGFSLFLVGFFIPLISGTIDRKMFLALFGIPKFIFFQFLSLMNAYKANRMSVATKHRKHLEVEPNPPYENK